MLVLITINSESKLIGYKIKLLQNLGAIIIIGNG